MKDTPDTGTPDLASIIGAKSPARRGRKWWFILAIVLAVAASVYYFRRPTTTSETTSGFVTQTVHRGDLSLSITATGNLEPTNEVTIGSELSGTVAEVYVDVNDRVTVNQKLALIEVRGLTQKINSSRANLNSAIATVNQVEASLAENEASLARLKELHELSNGKMPSKAQMVSAEATVTRSCADLESAQAAVEKATAELESSEEDQRKSILVSPINGIVLSRSIEPGQTVAANFQAPELFIIAEDLKQMQLDVAVAEADIGMVEDGQTAVFTVDAWPGREYQAEVSRVSFGSEITDNVVTYETKLIISNDDLSLRPGMTATADIRVAASNDVLLVPDSALRFNPRTKSATASAGTQKTSFVDSLIPKPPGRQKRGAKGVANGPGSGSRPAGGGPPEGVSAPPGPRDGMSGRPPGATPDSPTIWTLRDGKPISIAVKKGVSDGGFTEISGEGITDAMEVIVRKKSATS